MSEKLKWNLLDSGLWGCNWKAGYFQTLEVPPLFPGYVAGRSSFAYDVIPGTEGPIRTQIRSELSKKKASLALPAPLRFRAIWVLGVARIDPADRGVAQKKAGDLYNFPGCGVYAME